jgi:hypothetical protein
VVPTDQHCEVGKQVTPDRLLFGFVDGAGGTSDQRLPSQCKNNACSVPFTGAISPTAQQSTADEHATPKRLLVSVALESGLGTTVQAVPFQCSDRFCPTDCPTAQQSVLLAQATLKRTFVLVSAALGTIVQDVPSKCSMRETFAPT